MVGILPGIQQNLAGMQQFKSNQMAMQQQDKINQQEMQADQLLQQFQQGGNQDYGLVQQAVLLSPTKAKNVLGSIGIADDVQKKQAASDIVSLTSAISNPASFRSAVAKRIQAIKDRGGDPTDSVNLMNTYEQEGPEAALRELQFVGAALANEGYIKPELIGIGKRVEPMTAYQAASTDLRRQELQIKSLEAEQKTAERMLQRETNDLKRQELELQIQQKKEAIEKAKEAGISAKSERSAELESAKMGVDNMLNSVERILQTPESVIARATGPVDTRTPTVRQSTADFEELVSTLGSQAFLAQIPNIKGMGALSNAEGEKLQTAFQNFSLRQSPEQLKANLKEARRLLLKGRSNINKRYNAEPDSADVPAEKTESIAELLNRYGGR